MLTWYVYIGDFNAREIKEYNIFRHHSFLEECRKITKEYDKLFNETHEFDIEAYAADIKRELLYYFWSKCEWEIILQHWPTRDDFRDRKIDVYDQVTMNYDAFINYIWEHRRELLNG